MTLIISKEVALDYLKHPKISIWYSFYLRSPQWKTKCTKVKKRAGGICESCKITEGIFQVHHLTYERVTREDLKDLKYLCKECHEKAHYHQLIPYAEVIYQEMKDPLWFQKI